MDGWMDLEVDVTWPGPKPKLERALNGLQSFLHLRVGFALEKHLAGAALPASPACPQPYST